VPPGISDATVPNPVFNLTPAATVDEGNNWINISWGPLAMTNSVNNTTLGNYAPASTSSAINHITALQIAAENVVLVGDTTVPTSDFLGTSRPQGGSFDAGAIEFVAAPNTAILNVTGGPLSFGNVPINTTSAAQTLTLHNTGSATATTIAVAVTAPFVRSGGTCATTLAANSTCTITVVFSPAGLGAAIGTATITANVAVSGSPVNLSGTGVAQLIRASLTPTPYTYPAQTRNCPGQVLACAADPIQVFTLTNTGNVNLTGIGSGLIGGTNHADFQIGNFPLRLALTTCGTAGSTTLAPNATCTIAVKFGPLTTESAGPKSATLSITDAAGTQQASLSGQAN
jgi:hypothetical protein